MIHYRKLFVSKCCFLAICCILLSNPLYLKAQPNLVPGNKGNLSSTWDSVSRIMKREHIPAISYSYSKDGDFYYAAQGVKINNEFNNIDNRTVFQAASLTKVLAAYIFFRFMDKGLISLDKPLWDYYPYDRLKNHPYKQLITARMVLTHRTGLLNWEGDVPSDRWRKTPLTSQFKPGTDYMYSGEGFYFLQETLEHLTKKSFEELVEEEIFRPFDMGNSEMVWKDSLEQNAAFGHLSGAIPRKLGKYQKSNAAYTLYTTAYDYAKFIEKAIFKGIGLKPSTHQLMLEKASEAKKGQDVSPDDQYVPCALGMRMQINEVGTAYWHTGSNPGFRCFFIAYPETKEILTVFTNSEDGFQIIPDMLALFLNNNQTFWMYNWRQGELD